ncbi:hypothetical protein HZS_2126 [Henneguya salminicola]|nr:hypothetical protein HZS_2126 [Henneguya salminicola]
MKMPVNEDLEISYYWHIELSNDHILTITGSSSTPVTKITHSQTGACTNTIEGTWNYLKYKISPRNRINSLAKNGNIT